MVTWLRRIASYFFLTLAILFAALWVRSYWYYDWFHNKTSDPNVLPELRDMTSVRLANGFLVVQTLRYPVHEGKNYWEYSQTPANLLPTPYKPDRWLEWAGKTSLDGRSYSGQFIVPTWLPTLIFVLLAIAVRPKPRFKFGLRDLFTLTTVTALTIGTLAFWLR